ncbi:MAG: hypothetical protein A3G25_00145 [Betaproteobacteria bacterium RIFCSPLOWO2_12_FULL_63_13]|nr:MAG: hypothetical protein A3H32_12920 [Betaproteobacteria bacterium RIFCSPLOWO2_02_FULL_63_19]OGA51088.1 MAG: hypothetical protein A3G25_00145 [Betaproteobacteria bacterium RIFCSPLOWO2_12_FULL_63_13]
MNAGVEGSRGAASYEVLSPWANVDPVPLRGITPRTADLAGKKIGLFSNRKRAAELTLTAVETRLKEQMPSVETTWYTSTRINTPEALTEGKARFEAWVKSVDAVVLSVAD